MVDLKQALLDAGFRLISEHGYAGIGIMKIIQEANGTKGSFYHHFKSKEDFGRVLLENYFEEHLEILNQYLDDAAFSFPERVINYFEFWSQSKVTEDFQIQCLVVKLAGEMSGTSSSMQNELAIGSEKIITRMSDFFDMGNQTGDFSIDEPYITSRMLYGNWLGATLICALQKDRVLLSDAMTTTRQIIGVKETR
ncbi:TetR family transcriptional regulator [Vibrio sp. 10N.286.49.C2]|uniref:TetR/AcrR family transcriptional regulator n=1 Tax=unclassified Vibrio TaxID=2614977 RepID=UPI000C81D595|nr:MULTISPECIES: TetR/AcrR family transcriptional regulator [unclassified Vibrio]PMH40668.1 TetR family transcriptional regulator [Vibrio sp. 10N.286.49.C2]PMH45199.1 TetR family transcriptional regulator [Vibrio sp. 10N.286.49.B1]PMH78933.1 TetR family transcriptional regulator [Vibrio sp. 10N.286.48.B7]